MDEQLLEEGGMLLELVQVQVQVLELEQGLLQVQQGHGQVQVILSLASLFFLLLVSDFEDRSLRTDCLDWPSAVSNMAASLFCNPPSRAFWATTCEGHKQKRNGNLSFAVLYQHGEIAIIPFLGKCVFCVQHGIPCVIPSKI